MSDVRAMAGYVSWAESQIVRVFNDNRLPGRVLAGQQTPQLLVWQIILDDLSKSAVDRALDLERALSMALGAGGVRLARLDGTLTVEVPSPRRITLPARALPRGRALRVCVGRDLQLHPFWVDFSEFPHLLVLGSTKVGGKSETLRTIVWALARQNALRDVAFAFVDLKGGQALSPLAGVAHNLFQVATEVEEASHLVLWLLAEMERRLQDPGDCPHLFVVIDEVFRLVKDWPGADACLGELTSVARGASIHVIAASQRASKETLGSSLVGGNIVDRICGRVDNANSSFWALTVEKAGAEKLAGNGDVLAHVDGRLTRLQVGRVSKRDVERLPQGGGRRPIPRMTGEPELARQWGGHNRVDLQDEWVRWFQEGGSLHGARERFGLSSSVAYRAQEVAQRRNGGGP